MKYFLAITKNDKRHIVVARDLEQASKVICKTGMIYQTLYELKDDTYKEPGFLISDK